MAACAVSCVLTKRSSSLRVCCYYHSTGTQSQGFAHAKKVFHHEPQPQPCFYFLFRNRLLLNSSDCPSTFYVSQDNLKLACLCLDLFLE